MGGMKGFILGVVVTATAFSAFNRYTYNHSAAAEVETTALDNTTIEDIARMVPPHESITDRFNQETEEIRLQAARDVADEWRDKWEKEKREQAAISAAERSALALERMALEAALANIMRAER
jgi:hypothetical protein